MTHGGRTRGTHRGRPLRPGRLESRGPESGNAQGPATTARTPGVPWPGVRECTGAGHHGQDAWSPVARTPGTHRGPDSGNDTQGTEFCTCLPHVSRGRRAPSSVQWGAVFIYLGIWASGLHPPLGVDGRPWPAITMESRCGTRSSGPSRAMPPRSGTGWRTGRAPWGFLAGKAVIAYRRGLGRSLTDLERRRVWHMLWGTLSDLKRRRWGGEGAGLLADDRLHDP